MALVLAAEIGPNEPMHARALPRLMIVLPALLLLACADDGAGSDDEGQAETGTDTSDGDTGGTDGADTDTGTGDTGGEALRPNWHEDVAPVVYANCVGCHYDGGIAPFSLESYEQAAPWSALMNDAVADQIMPPWGALETEECQPDHSWRDDLRLSAEEKQLFADWLDAGSPEGKPEDAAQLPEPPSLELAEPNVVLQNPTPYTVGGTEDDFVCMVVDPGHTQDVWVTGVQMIPDNTQVVHHVLTYIDTNSASDGVADADGKFPCPGGFVSLDGASQISTWVPGGVPMETPPEVGFHMPVGAKVIMAYHYHPTGAGDEIDQSSIALRWTEEEPPVKAYMAIMGAAFNSNNVVPGPNDPGGQPIFEIPPNVADHTETVVYQLPDFVPPLDVFTVGTHMHYVGVDMKITIERGGEELCLVQTPRWDFNWQRNYDVDAPVGDMPKIQGGDTIILECTYNNTLDNPFLVEALAEQGLSEPITVGVGESSLDEMCVMLFGVATELPLEEFF